MICNRNNKTAINWILLMNILKDGSKFSISLRISIWIYVLDLSIYYTNKIPVLKKKPFKRPIKEELAQISPK